MSTVACPSCGNQTPTGFPRCAHCGAELAAAPAAPREERKVVTVLFCDLVGSTAQAERLDPEDVRALLSAYHERVRAELERFGGTVEKFIGDAVMALFGAPTAHEDDPERAVRAALAIRDGAIEARDMQVRIGITTGEALVALGARPEAGEAMAAGDVVNTGARIQSAAPVDGILVDATTYRATERAIDYAAGRPVPAKGKAEPIPVWEALQARARVGVEREAKARLVGREKELDVLVDALRRVREDREPQLVTLVGEPGIGKSRLVYELFRAIETGGQLTSWRQGRSLPYGEGVSYWALAEIVKAQAGVLESDDDATAAAKLRAAVAAAAPDGADAQWLERHLRPLLGLEGAPEVESDRRSEAFAAWRRFLEALAEQRPLVLVFEDLHFADEGVLDFVDYLADWASGVPLLVVGTARPELLARRPGWGGGKANSATLSLGPLSDEETGRLLRALLDRPLLSADVEETLHAHSGGNPLYAEEFVRALTARGSAKELPETVQGLIAARIDGLAQEEKALLQDAAVVGKVFWLGGIAALSRRERWETEELLHALDRKEFVRRERRSALAGETEYAFRHQLLRDVAYGQIPRAARAEKHRRAAEWIEAVGRAADHAELLAHHYLSALELLRAAGQPVSELAEAAAAPLREAGDRAFGLNAYPEAARYYAEALSLPPQGDRGGLLLRYGRALALADDVRFAPVLEEAADVLEATGDAEAAAEAHAFLTEGLHLSGERERAYAHMERAVSLVGDRPLSPAKVKVEAEWSRLLALGGHYDEALEIAQRAHGAAEALGLSELAARTLGTAGLVRSRLGDHRGGIADLERSAKIALAANSPEAVRAYHNAHPALWWLGETERAVQALEEAIRVSERLGAGPTGRMSRTSLVWLYYHRARWEEALAGAEASLAESEGGTPSYFDYQLRLVRARINLARGEGEDRVLVDLEAAIESGRTLRDPQALNQALAHGTVVYWELGRPEDARAMATELVEEVTGGSAQPIVLALIEVAPVASAVDLVEPLRHVLASDTTVPDVWRAPFEALLDGDFVRAADGFQAIGYVDEGVVRLRAAEQLLAEGRRAEADGQLQRALAFFHRLGATRYVREGEALLAGAA